MILITAEKRNRNFQNVNALLVRLDIRIAWVVASEFSASEIHSNLTAVLENWFGSQLRGQRFDGCLAMNACQWSK